MGYMREYDRFGMGEEIYEASGAINIRGTSVDNNTINNITININVNVTENMTPEQQESLKKTLEIIKKSGLPLKVDEQESTRRRKLFGR